MSRARRAAFTLLELQVAVIVLLIVALGMANVLLRESRHLRKAEEAAPDGGVLYLRASGDPLAAQLGLLAEVAATPPGPPSPPAGGAYTVTVLEVTRNLAADEVLATVEQQGN